MLYTMYGVYSVYVYALYMYTSYICIHRPAHVIKLYNRKYIHTHMHKWTSVKLGNWITLVTVSMSVFFLWYIYYGFMTCYHWQKLGKRHKKSLCIISYNFMWAYSYLNKNFDKKMAPDPDGFTSKFCWSFRTDSNCCPRAWRIQKAILFHFEVDIAACQNQTRRAQENKSAGQFHLWP